MTVVGERSMVPPRTPAMALTIPPPVRDVAWGLVGLAVASVSFVAFLVAVTPLQQARDQDLLYDRFREQLAAATAPTGTEPIPPGSPVAIVQVPSLELRQVVVEGTAGEDLRAGPGHVRTTVLPGQLGIAAIYGRSTTYGSPFNRLPSLSPGRALTVITGQGRFRYEIEAVRRAGDPLPAAMPDSGSRLTLVTTEGATLRAQAMVYVDAVLVSDPAPTPSRQGLLLPAVEAPLASDSSALSAVALWLLAGVVLAFAVTWGVLRWGIWQTWAIAVPVTAAVVWGTFDSAALLLPNLL